MTNISVRMTEAQMRASALKRHEHARKCKKQFQDCSTCRANASWFDQLPLHWLNEVLKEKG